MNLFKYLRSFPLGYVALLCSLTTLIVVGSIVFFMGYQEVAWFIGNIGTVVVLAASGIHIIFFDSRKRWPGSS